MARRSRAREVTLQLLFQQDQNPTPVPRPAIEQFAQGRLLGDREMTRYCLRGLFDGALAHQPEIDAKLTATATNWRLSRMQPSDRSVLRMAIYELLFDPRATAAPGGNQRGHRACPPLRLHRFPAS